MPGKRRFTVDVESTSTVDLKRAGAAAYWEHPDTKIICLCYRIDNGPVITWVPGDPVPYFVPELDNYGWRVVAHNWLFEYNCWKHALFKHGWKLPPMYVWDCTMARSLYWGLPAGLGDVCDALGLPVVKDASARSLMLRMSKPRSLDPITGKPVWWHDTDPYRVKDLIAYCETDVRAECCLDDALPPLPDRERQIFLIDGKINQRGVLVDADMTRKLQAITQAEGARLNGVLQRLTLGRVKTTNQVAAIMADLVSTGFPVPSLAKADVSAAISHLKTVPGAAAAYARAVLECRQEAAKASTAKLGGMLAGVSPDGRCRGLLQYGGAGRTLRWAGRRVQPQNYPRGTVKGLASVFAMVEQGATVDELSALLPGSVMDAVSSMLRGCLIASPGNVFVSGDLSQIEARVLPWLAGQKDILAVFARGDDVYTYTANGVGSNSRQFGKVLVLGLGFGMSGATFQATAALAGITLTLEEAEEAVRAWRALNHRIVAFWWDVDRAFKLIAGSPHGTSVKVGEFITIRKTKKAVRIVLPSGRELTYQNVELETDQFGRDAITYMGVHPKTKKWTRIRTYGGRLVENIVQATARDVMAEAMIELDQQGASMVLTVHDELLAEAPECRADAALKLMLKALSTTPSWAPGLPVAAEGWFGKRYRK